MTWVQHAARSLAGTLDAWFDADGVVVAAAALDLADTAVARGAVDLPADGRFELGSVTKTLTATVLAALAGDGALRLDDEIGRWLAAGPHGGITVRQLATHTSGLPAQPPNLRARQVDPADPWAGYTFTDAEEGLRQASAAPGNPWRYSNLGYQLLGLILERASGTGYPTLIDERLLAPLAMARSGVGGRGHGTPLPGHADGRPVPAWHSPWGAGGVETTIEDLARYVRACLVPARTPLGAAIALAQTPVLRIDGDTHQALAWVVRSGTIIEHSGGTGGFCACVTVDRGRGRAVAVLASHAGGPATSSRLKQAAHLTLADGDPRAASAPQPWPTWRDDAREVALALLGGRVAQVHPRLARPRRETVTVEQLERAWAGIARRTGPGQDAAIARHEVAANGAVVADVAVGTASGAHLLRVVVLPSGELGGFALLSGSP